MMTLRIYLTNISVSDILISMENIGRKIKELVKKEKVSVYRVAEDLGIADESLYRSLADGSDPRWKTINKVLDYLGYEIRFSKSKRKEVKPSKPSRPRKRG